MDERKLEKLRDVVVERLSSGEDPAALREQLARELSAEQADGLIADARQRLEIGRDDPKLARSVEGIRKRRQAGEALRPVARPPKPGSRVTAAVFGGLGALLLVGPVIGLVTRQAVDYSPFIGGLVLLAPSVVLWRSNSLIAAGVLVAVSGLGLAASLFFAITSMDTIGLSGFPIAALWLILTAVAVRAVLKVRAACRSTAATPAIAAEVFD